MTRKKGTISKKKLKALLEEGLPNGKPKEMDKPMPCPEGFVDFDLRLPPVVWEKVDREAAYRGVSRDEHINDVIMLKMYSELKTPYDFYMYTKILKKLGNLARIHDWFHVLVPAGLTLQMNIGVNNAS